MPMPMQAMAYAPRSMAAPSPMRPGAIPPPPAAPALGGRGTGAPPPAEDDDVSDLLDERAESEAAPEQPEERTRVSEVAKARPQAPKKESKGFFERVRGAFTGRSSTVIIWFGRIAFAGNGQVAIELVASDRRLEWKVLPEAVLLMKDGTQVRLPIDASRTTRDGAYESGAVIRFVLQVPAGFDASQIAHVTIGDVQVEVH
jgi:hypothetical protein